MIYNYTIYGISLAVPFPCSMLPQAAGGGIADVVVKEGLVPYNLTNPAAEGKNWQASPGCFLLRGGRRAGRFLVEGGRQITLERNPAAEDGLLSSLLTTSVIVALLRQRGMLVLHANVAVTQHGSVTISGKSGSGKSTTQAALMARGCRMLTDDVTVLQMENDGTVVALPGIPKMNLCEDAAVKLGYDISCLSRSPLQGIKVVVPVQPDESVTVPVPLKKVYLINSHQGEGLIITHLAGTEKFAALQECIYGPLFPEEHPGIFSVLSALISQVDIFRLQRPIRGCSVKMVVEAIMHG